MNYVCFGHPPWDPLVLNRLLSLLPADAERFWIVERSKTDILRAYEDGKAIPLSALTALEPKQTVALVFHPFWIRVINQFNPKYLIAFISFQEPEEDRLLHRKYWAYLAAQATLVCTDSERVYLEQCFRRGAVFFLHSDSDLCYDIHSVKGDTLLLNDCEVLFRDAVASMFRQQSASDLVECQWRLRIAHYQKIAGNTATLGMDYFHLAVYHYLLDQTDTARNCLLKSMEHTSLAGKIDCLISPDRFLSAIEAKAGQLEQAVSNYGSTCLDPDEKANHLHLLDLLDQGERDELQANLYLLGEDYKSAASLFSQISTDSARRGLLQTYIRMNESQKALGLVASFAPRSTQDRRDHFLLKGIVEEMKANRHQAIHSFLRAAAFDYEVITHILEMRSVDERVAEFIRGEKG